MKVVPIGERVLVKPVKAEEKTAGGIYLPENEKEKNNKGIVEAVGQLKDAKLKEGDQVIFESYSGTEITLQGKKLKLLNIKDVLAKIEKE